MHKAAAIVTVLLLGLGCSHAQKKINQDQSQAMRAPAPPPKLVPPPSENNEVASSQSKNDEAIYFDFDSALLRPDTRPELQTVASELKKAHSVRIEGNCDERGTTEYNLALGDRRARSAADYLERLGIPKKRVSVVTYGSEHPRFPGHEETVWAKNRRDDFIIR